MLNSKAGLKSSVDSFIYLRTQVRKLTADGALKRAKMDLIQISVVLLGLISVGSALECYVCDKQPDNRDKCVKTTIQCRQHQDTCKSFIHWRQPSYWTPRSERIFSIDKACDTRANCEQESRNRGLRCMRDHYRDWKCTECCQGDRCNYYVTLGASSLQISTALLVTALAVLQILRNYLR